MKSTKAISLLLSLSLAVFAALPALAAPTAAAQKPDEGMQIAKTATANSDGSYTVTLEAYATGEKFSTEITKDIPADIVLVLDQSGSMTEDMNTYDFRAYTGKSNSDYYELRHNGGRNPNLYYKLEDGSYGTVSVERAQTQTDAAYTVCPANWTNGGYTGTENYYANQENLYVKVGEEYQKVTLIRSGNFWYTYTYTFPDGSQIVSERINTVPDFQGMGPLYVRSVTQEYDYTYSYTDHDGNRQTIGTSRGNHTQPTEFSLYERYSSGTMSRLAALQAAVSGFTDSVAKKAAGEDGVKGTADDVDHRVAVVGFATGSSGAYGYPSYENTEVFVGSSQYPYNTTAKHHYREALQAMNTAAGYNNVLASNDALTARGATYPNYGMEMAKGILDANPVSDGERRNRVVVLFTDGTPGWSDYESDVAEAAVKQAKALKNAGVTVYSVGIFEGADATADGIAQGANNRQANQFMQDVSSNNGTPQNPSYYLSASDADTLNNIFQQISDNIESGGAATTLGAQTVIQDLVSDYFSLPAGTDAQDITVQTAPCTGITGGLPSWGEPQTFTGAQVSVDAATGAVEVSGFDFAGNYVGMDKLNGTETLHEPANKLLISFCVEPKDGFLGGNGVPTNAGAYIYENKDATVPVFEFDKPTVDVPIGAVSVTAEDRNVYLLGSLTADGMQAGATIKIGDVELKPDEANYGLQSWQNAYVDITVEVKDKDGNIIADDLNGLTEDSEYTVSVKVSPKTTGSAKEQTGEGNGQIHVYKPQLTFKDSEAWYGDTAPADLNANLTGTKWLHGKTEADASKMGVAPDLALTFTPDASKLDNGKINTKQDVPVDVGVKIGQTDVSTHTTFQHTNCDGKTCELPQDMEFLLHINTCQLTVTKTGGAAGEPYVFTVYRDDSEYSEVTIVGNGSETIYELPVGSYTISEDEGWSWRYVGTEGAAVDLSKDNTSGSISCTNSKTENYWLNGFSDVVKNIFGAKN